MRRIYQPAVKKLSSAALQRYFQRENFNHQPINNTVLNDFINEITQKYFVNVGAKLFYLLPQDQETFYSVIHWLGYERYPTVNVLRNFLIYPSAVKTELGISESLTVSRGLRFRNLSGFTLDGELAEILYFGGAYNELSDPSAAKRLAKNFTDILLQERFSDFVIYTTNIALGNWYGDIGIDFTFLIFDQIEKNYYVLAISDVD